MDLLFQREQTSGGIGRVNFKLWGKLELDEEEESLIEHYQFRQAILIAVLQPELLRQAVFVGLGVAIVCLLFLVLFVGVLGGSLVGLCVGGGVGYWYLTEKRETIFVSDLLHGRHFKCASVVDLARKEAWLTTVVSYLRQVLESAKHWDGVEQNHIEPLPKEEARQVILRGL